jgi:uncharacterized protein with PIN domain
MIRAMDNPRFIADENVGKLGRLLRLAGFDTALFSGEDRDMVRQALREERIVVTRDTRIRLVRPAQQGQLKVVTLTTDEPEVQLCQVVRELGLTELVRPFSRCVECNQPLAERTREQVAQRVPPYVYATQTQYRECPGCGRIYWRGTHWQAMARLLETVVRC